MDKQSIAKRLEEQYGIASKEGVLLGVFLKGSQNYIKDMFFEGSDVDSKAIIIPTKREILLGKDVSKSEIILDNNEQIDRYDIRKYFEVLKKPGINNWETLFTEHYFLNKGFAELYEELIAIREEISRIDEKGFLMATMGISMRDLKTLQNRTGSQDAEIERYGYSRKRLSNIMRFNETVKAYVKGAPFSECLRSMDQELINKVRRTEMYSSEEALEIAEKCDSETKQIATDFQGSRNTETLEKMDDLLVKFLSTQL